MTKKITSPNKKRNEARAKLETQYRDYLQSHPEINQIVSEFLSQIIIQQPKDVYSFGANYFKSMTAIENNVVIVCGPSGVGKGTLLKSLFAKFDKLSLSVSHTTREPRDNEIEGVHYFFTDKEVFQRKIEDGNYFIEHANVHGNFYGTSFEGIKKITDQQKVCVLEIDIQGAQKVIEQMEVKPKILYIAPPSIEVLKERLLTRGSETEESVKLRIANAEKEIEWCESSGECDSKVVNDDFEKALKEFETILLDWFPHLA